MNDPYAAPSALSDTNGAPVLEPRAIKVFGILHIIFGIIGILFTALGLVVMIAFEPLMNLVADAAASSGPPPAGTPDPSESLRMMGKMFSSLMPYYVVSSLVGIVLAILLLRAGISLAKRRKSGPKQSNIWSWAVLIFLVINLPVSLFYVLPIQSEFQQDLNSSLGSSAGPSSGPGMAQAEKIGNIVGSVIGAIFYSIYPILALVFLKRRKVGEFLQEHGK